MAKLAISVKEMSQQLGISLPKAYELTEIEGFPVIRVGRKKVIPIDALQRWIDQQAERPTCN